jgi:hypothetical protein
MRIEKDKTYITTGGYVVKLNYNLCAPGMSPGENDDYCAADPGGWHWEKDGGIIGLTPEWIEKLKIVEECPFEVPALPEGYRWTDGFPQVRIPKKGEYFLSYDSRTKTFSEVKCCDGNYITPYGTDGRRLILAPETPKETWPRYFVGECWGDSDAYIRYDSPTSSVWVTNLGNESPRNTIMSNKLTKEDLAAVKWKEVTLEDAMKRVINKSVPVVVKYYKHREKFGGQIVFIKRIGATYNFVCNNSAGMDHAWDSHANMNVSDGIWIEISEGDALKLLNVNSVTSVADVSSSKNEKVIAMKKETALKVVGAVARFAGNWGFRALNYWVFEPAAGFGKPIVKSVRYATFLGMVGGSVYGYYHPQEVKDAIKSCLPKITIEAPEIMQG